MMPSMPTSSPSQASAFPPSILSSKIANQSGTASADFENGLLKIEFATPSGAKETKFYKVTIDSKDISQRSGIPADMQKIFEEGVKAIMADLAQSAPPAKHTYTIIAGTSSTPGIVPGIVKRQDEGIAKVHVVAELAQGVFDKLSSQTTTTPASIPTTVTPSQQPSQAGHGVTQSSVASPFFSKRGIENPRNYCYMIASLQGLAHVPTFCDFVKLPAGTTVPTLAQFTEACEALKPLLGKSTPQSARHENIRAEYLKTCLNRIFDQLKAPISTPLPKASLNELIQAFSQAGLDKVLASGNEEDAIDFINPMLTLIGCDIEWDQTSTYSASGYSGVAPIDRTSFHSNFLPLAIGDRGRLQFECQLATDTSDIHDIVFQGMGINRPKEFAKGKQCSKTTSFSLTGGKAPQFLPVQVLRFQEHGPKIHTSLESIPRELNVPTSDPLKPAKYELCAVVCHRGPTAQYGHYVTYVPEGPMQWLKFDDKDSVESQVMQSPEDVPAEAKQNGYVLMYKLVSVPQHVSSSVVATRSTSTRKSSLASAKKARTSTLPSVAKDTSSPVTGAPIKAGKKKKKVHFADIPEA